MNKKRSQEAPSVDAVEYRRSTEALLPRSYPRLLPLGDRTLLVEWGEAIDPVINRRVQNFAGLAERAELPGVRDIVPGYTTVALHYDPLRVSTRRGELPLLALSR